MNHDREEKSSLRPSWQRRLQRSFLVLTWGLAAYSVLIAVPAAPWWLEVLRHGRQCAAVTAAGLLVIALAVRSWWYVVTFPACAAWLIWPVWEYRFPQMQPPPGATAGRPFTVLTCNLLWEARDPEIVLGALRQADADVLLLLEFTDEWQRQLAPLLETYPHGASDPHADDAFGIGLASRLETARPPAIHYAAGVPFVEAVLKHDGKEIAFAGVHPLPPFGPDTFDAWNESAQLWRTRLDALSPQRGGLRLLAGDFNCTPFARTFAQLLSDTGLRDSARGFGLRCTWRAAGTPLWAPIDHVLVSDRLAVVDHAIGPDIGSDHRWVLVTLQCR